MGGRKQGNVEWGIVGDNAGSEGRRAVSMCVCGWVGLWEGGEWSECYGPNLASPRLWPSLIRQVQPSPPASQSTVSPHTHSQ